MGTTLAERISALSSVVAEHVADMEQQRRLSDAVVEGLRATGLNRSLVPAALGGDERHVLEVLEAIEQIASMDGSTGWCAAIGAGSNMFAGYLPKEAAAEVFADPDQGNAGMFAPMGQVRPDGEGLRLTGRWPFCSNSLHSRWIGLGSFWFTNGDEPEPMPRLVLVPMDDVAIETTWDAPGLCGTGSHHASVDGVVVDREHSLTFADRPWADGPLWNVPLFCVLGPVLGITALGIARGAVDEITAKISSGAGAMRGALADDPVGLADFAKADAALRAARSGIFEAAARAWELAERGDRAPKLVQAQIAASMSHGSEVAVEVTSAMHRLGGGAAAYAGSSLGRRLRDVQTARQHILFGHSHRPAFAKALAGDDTPYPPFLV
jgi:alkylation response protein AidB-like acyl-CoA dehydrogenase